MREDQPRRAFFPFFCLFCAAKVMQQRKSSLLQRSVLSRAVFLGHLDMIKDIRLRYHCSQLIAVPASEWLA